MGEQYKFILKKYVFDNNIDYLNNKSEFGRLRFETSLGHALAIAHFYKMNPDIDVMEKDVVSVLSRMTQRNMYVAVLETQRPVSWRKYTSDIIAASMISEYYFPIRVNGQIVVQRFIEAGGMRSIYRGFGIQKIMHYIRLMDRMLIEPHGYYFGATYADSKNSQFNLPKIGLFESKDIIPELIEYRLYELERKNERSRGVKFFRVSTSTILQAAEYLTRLQSDPIINRKSSYMIDRPEVSELEVIFDIGLHPDLFMTAARIHEAQPKTKIELESVLGIPIGDEFLAENNPKQQSSVDILPAMVRVI